MNRHFLRKISTESTCEVLLADDHAAFVPQLGQEVWISYQPWKVVEVIKADDHLHVIVEPIDPTPSPACPLRR